MQQDSSNKEQGGYSLLVLWKRQPCAIAGVYSKE
jgi:hypothetical protein